MKIKIFFLLLLLSISCHPNNKNQADINAIRQWATNYEQAIKASSVDTILAGVSDSITYYPPNQPAFSGKDNLRRWYTDYFSYYDPSELLIIRKVNVEGDIAYLSCYYAIYVKVKSSGEEYRDNGKLINIFKREYPGNWKCIFSIWNSNNRNIDFHSRIPADFSGDWELDMAQSTPVPDLVSSKISITQQGDRIMIRRSYEVRGRAPFMSVVNCTIGSEIKDKSKSGSQVTTSFWSTDKHSFTIIEKLISSGEEYKRTTNYSLTTGGESLKVALFDQIPHGLLDSTGMEQIVLTFKKIN